MLKAILAISKKSLIFLLGIMLAASMVFFISPGKIYGEPDAATNITTGVSYATIQGAIDAAGDGDTIEIESGIHDEAIEIKRKTGLKIQGDGMPVIKGGKSVTTDFGDRDCIIFVSESSNVELSGLSIEGEKLGEAQGGTNQKSYAVIYEKSSTGKIYDCNISPNTVNDAYGTGIAMWVDTDLTIENCTIENYGRVGIYAYAWGSACSGKISNNNIKGPAYTGTDDNLLCYGIEIESGAEPVCNFQIESNNIYDNFNGPAGYGKWKSGGIVIDGFNESYASDLPDSVVIVENNNIYKNENGILVAANTESYAHDNSIYDNLEEGIYSVEAEGVYEIFNATNNWWGDSSGPSGGVADPVTGTIADGSGDEVSTHVHFDPWTTHEETKQGPEEEKIWVRNHDMTCFQVWVNEDNCFEFIFWWEYKNNNHVQIFDMAGNLVWQIDFEKGDPNFEACLPDGMYTVKTFHEPGEILQEFIIGKP